MQFLDNWLSKEKTFPKKKTYNKFTSQFHWTLKCGTYSYEKINFLVKSISKKLVRLCSKLLGYAAHR